MAGRQPWMASVLTAVAAVAACGGGAANVPSQAQSAPTAASSASTGKLEAGATGFGLSRSMAETGLPDYVWAATIVSNSTDLITGLTASFSAFDPSGAVIGQGETSAPIMRAGARMAVGTVVEVPAGAEVSKVVATVSPLENLSRKDEHPESNFTAIGVHFQPSSIPGGDKVLGEIVSGYQQTVNQVYVSVVCYDAGGAIIGGGEHYVAAIAPGQRVGFATDSLIVSGEPARCEAFASLSGLS